jgi:7-keto-8-aminopelargonate synthetase-like enzyme
LEWARREHAGKRIFIVTESVFSMDGDRAPLRELVQLKKQFDTLLMLDEAHAVGVFGPHGRGLAAAENLSDDVDVQMGTMSKAFGASGGYVCGSHKLIEWLINRARSFIYSTAPPPAIDAAALAAVDSLSSPEGEERRLLLRENISLMRELLPSDIGRSPSSSKRSTFNSESVREQSAQRSTPTSAIFPLLVGDEQSALDLAAALKTEGFLVPAIRYPTVAKGSARLRITVSSAHQEDHVRSLCEAIKRCETRISLIHTN